MSHARGHPDKLVVCRIDALNLLQLAHGTREVRQAVCGHVQADQLCKLVDVLWKAIQPVILHLQQQGKAMSSGSRDTLSPGGRRGPASHTCSSVKEGSLHNALGRLLRTLPERSSSVTCFSWATKSSTSSIWFPLSSTTCCQTVGSCPQTDDNANREATGNSTGRCSLRLWKAVGGISALLPGAGVAW